MICFFILLFIDQPLKNPKGGTTAFGRGYMVPIFPNKSFLGFMCPALAHVGRYLMYLLSTLL